MKEKELTLNKESELAGQKKVEHWLTPAVDIYENDQGLTLMADLPGVPKDRLNLGIDKGVITIEALAPVKEGGTFGYREFGVTGFYRRFQLPDNLELDRISADMKDGVLTIQMPKTEAARPRKIEVTVH